MQINYKIAEAKARKLMREGFGKTQAIRAYNQMILSRIETKDLTQMVAVAIWVSKREKRNFYSCLCKEISAAGFYKNQRNVKEADFIVCDFKEERQVKQLQMLYQAIGFSNFYKYLKPDVPKSTVQKWTWKAFGKRKNEERIKRKDRAFLEKILSEGGRIRFSKESNSIYIENNEHKLRLSDHQTSFSDDLDQNFVS